MLKAVAGLAFLVSAVSGYGWLTRDRAPAKDGLIVEGGVVTRVQYVHTETHSSAVTGVRFWVSSDVKPFYYVSFFPNFERAKKSILPGARVSLSLAAGDREIWRAEVGDELLGDYDQFTKARHDNGIWGGIVCITLALAGAGLWRLSR